MRDALIIDDTAQEAIALGRMLATEGWRSTTCGNGDIALAMLDYQPFDLVVADVVMEGMVGTALLDAIRSTPARYFMPVVFVSAMPESRVRRIIAGDYTFLRKPLARAELMAAVSRASLRSLVATHPQPAELHRPAR